MSKKKGWYNYIGIEVYTIGLILYGESLAKSKLKNLNVKFKKKLNFLSLRNHKISVKGYNGYFLKISIV